MNEGRIIADAGAHRSVVVETLSLAFADDPAMTFLKPDATARRRMLPKFFRHMSKEDAKLGTVETSPGGEVATLWRAPGRHKEQLYGDFGTTLAFLHVLGFAASRGGIVGAAMARHHPQEEHWYLRFIGVRPEAQGKGWGGVALKHGLARADADGLPCYLETATPENVGLYQRFGFAVIDEWDIPGGGPHFWGMWREVGV